MLTDARRRRRVTQSETIMSQPAIPSPQTLRSQRDPLTAALDLLAWFSTRDWAQIAHHPAVATTFSRHSTTAALLVEEARASLPVGTTPIILCCHDREVTPDERPSS